MATVPRVSISTHRNAPASSWFSWADIPLIAYFVICIGPVPVALIIYLSFQIVGLSERVSFNWDRADFFISLLTNLPLIALWQICREKMIRAKELPTIRSAQFAMWGALIGMSLLSILWAAYHNIPLVLGTLEPYPQLLYTLLAMMGGMWIIEPVFGVVGWFVGRFIAWVWLKAISK